MPALQRLLSIGSKASMSAGDSNLSNQVPTAPGYCHGNSVVEPGLANLCGNIGIKQAPGVTSA